MTQLVTVSQHQQSRGPNIEAGRQVNMKPMRESIKINGWGGGWAHRALPHSTVLPPIFCHGVDVDVVVMGTDSEEVAI